MTISNKIISALYNSKKGLTIEQIAKKGAKNPTAHISYLRKVGVDIVKVNGSNPVRYQIAS